MKDSDWQILYELHKTPNITKVANRLYITQPSLTKRLKVIEGEFQIQIVNRTTKGVEFTKEGEILAAAAEQYIRFLEHVHKDLRVFKESDKKIISIGTPYTYSKFVFSEILSVYSADHPRIRFEIKNAPSNLLFREACDQDLDAAFLRGDYNGEVIQRKMDIYTAYIMTKEPIQLEDLPKLSRIDYRTNDRSKELMDRWWSENFEEPQPTGMYAGAYIDVAWQLAAKGLGYTCCFLPKDYENPHNLVLTPMCNQDGTPIKRNTWFVYKQRKHMSDDLEAFIQYVEDNFIIND